MLNNNTYLLLDVILRCLSNTSFYHNSLHCTVGCILILSTNPGSSHMCICGFGDWQQTEDQNATSVEPLLSLGLSLRFPNLIYLPMHIVRKVL